VAEGWALSSGDCDDSDPDVVAPVTWYEDVDGDGWGDAASAQTGCAPPEGAVLEAGDCDDGDPSVAQDCGDEGTYSLPDEVPTVEGKPPEPDFGFGCSTGPRQAPWLVLLLLAWRYRFQR
jgi:hypothetical protein